MNVYEITSHMQTILVEAKDVVEAIRKSVLYFNNAVGTGMKNFKPKHITAVNMLSVSKVVR